MILLSHNETEIIARHRHRFSDEFSGNASLMNLIAGCSTTSRMLMTMSRIFGIPVPGRIKYVDPNLVSQMLKNKTIEKTVIKLLTGNSSKGVFYEKNPEHTQSIVKELIKNIN